MLASQPITPPMTNHKMIPMSRSPFCLPIPRRNLPLPPKPCNSSLYLAAHRLGVPLSVHAGVPLALIGVQLVVKRLQAAAEYVRRPALVALEVFEGREDEGALDFLERRPDGQLDQVIGRALAFRRVPQRGHVLFIQ